MKYILKNWKTTLAGFFIFANTILLQNGVITLEQSTLVGGLLASFGLVISADAKNELNKK